MGRNFHRQQNYTLNRGNDGVRKYNQHNDRSDNSSSRRVLRGGREGSHNKVWSRLGSRQVSFGDEGSGGGNRRGGIATKGGLKYQSDNIKIHVVFPEGEEDMSEERQGDQAGRGRALPRMARGKYRGVRGGSCRTPPGIVDRGNGNPQSFLSWQKIILKNGFKYDKIVLLKELLARSNIKFIPICYTKQAMSMNTFFYLEDQAAARALKALDRKIEMPDGYPLQITTERSTPPNMPLTEQLMDTIKIVMSDRYRAETKALNLKSFHTDEKFAGESFYAPLWRSNVMNKVVTVVVENIPEVMAIDLSSNKLSSSSLELLSAYRTKLNNLKILYLENNQILDVRNLQKFKGIQLEELKLTGNPLVGSMGSSYTDVIRKIFPSLKILDGKELPPIIGFEEDEVTSSADLPPSIAKFIKDPWVEDAVVQFLKAYYEIYDSDKRQNLLAAYHDSATFSMSAVGGRDHLSAYIQGSRNLLKVENKKRRHDLLRTGKLGVVAFLEKLPKTEHDMNTFTLDVPFSTESMMIFTVTGFFRERGTNQSGVRHFTRCFVVVPNGVGFNIINETLFVMQATDLSKRKAFVTETTTSQPSTSSPAVSVVENIKKSLALSFSQKSGMNLQFSAKCLQENNWDFDKAALIFSEAKAKGTIPPEAFQQTQ